MSGQPSAIAIADFDSDAVPDVATANAGTGNVTVLFGRGDGGFRETRSFDAGAGPTAIAAADVDGDGHTDLVTANADSDDISVLVGNGDGTFASQKRLAIGDEPSALDVNDFDGDGALDVAVANASSGTVSLLSGWGDGSFRPAQEFLVLLGPESMATADFDRDGATDLITENGLLLVNQGPFTLPGSSPGALSGAWFDPARAGEGMVVELLPGERARVSWFTYSTDGKQAWIIGNGPVIGDSVRIDDAFRTSGGRFGDGFAPDAIELKPWGSLRLRFPACNRAQFHFNGPSDYGSASQTLVRLTRIAGLPCTSDHTGQAATALGISGAWFDPERSGEGLVVEELPDGRARVSWFTYRPEGGQAWMVGNGPIEGNRVVIDNAFITDGGFFGDAFDASAIEFLLSGELRLTFDACNRATLDFEPSLENFHSGEQQLVRLTRMAGSACNL